MVRRSLHWLPALALAAFATMAPARADVSLPHIFGDHMVLQRDREVPVWGWADAREKVSVQLGTLPAVSTTAGANGEWRVKLPAMPAGGPFTLKVSGKSEVVFEDVLVGEVWLCSGQSNMQMAVASCINPEEEKAAANFPRIRHIAVPRVPASLPQKDLPKNGDKFPDWQACSPETVSGFSAAAYFFGRHLHRELDVPVGLIHSSWGGTRIEPWTPPAGFVGIPALTALCNQVRLADPRTREHKDALGRYLEQVDAWTKTARASLAAGALLSPTPAYPPELLAFTTHGQPTTLYNGMIHPLVSFAIRGAIWYQGESNHGEGPLYTEKMRALVGGWRAVWGQDAFPFYYVQIAPYHYNNENPNVLPEFWEAQTAALSLPNTGMAVITDVGDVNDIHPKNKQEAGRRLALLALARTYGRQDVVCDGPAYKEMQAEPGRIRVRFANVGGGLASRDGKPLTWFEVVGQGVPWTQAQATIEGDSVLVSAPEVKEPLAVRFAWHRNAEPNLMNQEGLPANSFRAGSVPNNDPLLMEVPEAKEYRLVYSLDPGKAGAQIVYDEDRRAQIPGPFDRVAYFLELQKEGEPVRWVYVSLDAFTTELGKIGVPTFQSRALFQQKASNMNVLSNAPGIATGTGLKEGYLEFWPHNYGAPNAANVPGASTQVWDFGDQFSSPEDGYGSMQIHNAAAKQTIFAYNSWKRGVKADLGIGNSTGANPDWTFAANADTYAVKRLRVLVRVKK